jgi:prepilin-type N-terminal cleavage/methylation domain-containing protein
VVAKKAFSMIEMIFAIVIIGITVAGVSRMMTQNVNTMGTAMSQEAVFLASMEAAKVFSRRWDANSKDPADALSYSKILDTGVADYRRTCIDLTDGNRTQTTTASCPDPTTEILSVLRLGGIAEDSHRRFHSAWTTPAGDNPDGVPDISKPLDLTGADGYKHEYNISIASDYVGSAFALTASGTSDIKKTEISVYQVENNGSSTLLVRMPVYSYNIGEFDYAKRTFQ